MRFYGFRADELTTAEAPNLDLAVDPKVSWALRNRERFPVDVNTAPREDLLRIPGLGARNVKRILAARRWTPSAPTTCGAWASPCAARSPFWSPPTIAPRCWASTPLDLRDRIAPRRAQIDLFETATAAAHGEL